tara:strand:- start:566 stop:958 length:393 start_codon:yes stop_codon:yes gene_type:complete
VDGGLEKSVHIKANTIFVAQQSLGEHRDKNKLHESGGRDMKEFNRSMVLNTIIREKDVKNLEYYNMDDELFDAVLDSQLWEHNCDPLGSLEQQSNANLREFYTCHEDDEFWNQMLLDGVISNEDYLYLDY